jgi:hypothetical protein
MAAALVLSACAAAPTYIMEGKKYDSAESFKRATDDLTKGMLAQITPLPRPLTGKKLVASFPSVAAQLAEAERRHVTIYNKPTPGRSIEQITALAQYSLDMHRAIYEAMAKRGIYQGVTIVESKTLLNSMEPAADYDVLYFTEGAVGMGQLFYASAKHGKQVFAFDKSAMSPEARANSMIEAVQVLAMRE